MVAPGTPATLTGTRSAWQFGPTTASARPGSSSAASRTRKARGDRRRQTKVMRESSSDWVEAPPECPTKRKAQLWSWLMRDAGKEINRADIGEVTGVDCRHLASALVAEVEVLRRALLEPGVVVLGRLLEELGGVLEGVGVAGLVGLVLLGVGVAASLLGDVVFPRLLRQVVFG